jgi:streptogramin lyase
VKRSLFVALVALAGCSGSVQTVPLATPAPPAGAAAVTFSIRNIPASTQSIVLSLDATTLQTIGTNRASRACERGRRGPFVCTAHADVPSGPERFDLIAYDEPRGAGNVLAGRRVTATLVPGQRRELRISLTGKVASLSLTLNRPHPPAGTPAIVALQLAALDADGNAILGSYGITIQLADSDTSGATKLSVSSISRSSTAVTLAYDGAPLSRAILDARAPQVARATTVFAPPPTIVSQRNVPPIPATPQPVPAGLADLCIGPDGNVWGTASTGGAIEKIADDGRSFTAYPILGTDPLGISAGPDGNLWFVEELTGRLGKITTSGRITTYKIPVPYGGFAQPAWTAPGPDGRTWFVDQGTIVAAGAATSHGKITIYPLPANAFPNEIVAGPDGNLWITDAGNNAIDVISPSGKVLAEHDIPTPDAAPWGITVGPDKNLWFAEYSGNKIGRMTTAGNVKEFDVPTALGGPLNVTAGPDGNVWFAETGGGELIAGKVGYVTTGGSRIRDFPTNNLFHVHNLVFDANRALWFSEFDQLFSKLGKLIY